MVNNKIKRDRDKTIHAGEKKNRNITLFFPQGSENLEHIHKASSADTHYMLCLVIRKQRSKNSLHIIN